MNGLMMVTGRIPFRHSLLLLVVLFFLLPAVPLQAQDCRDVDLAFTFLEVDGNGLITFDDLSIASYEVMACEVETNPPGFYECDLDTEYFTVETPSCLIPDFDPDNTYWYGVTGRTTEGCLIAGRARDYRPREKHSEVKEIEGTLSVPVLLPPENVAFNPGGTTVTWDAVADAKGYIVEWRQDPDDSWTRAENDDTSYDIPNFETDVPYSVRVLTVNSEGVAGPASDIVDWTPPNAPRNLRIKSDGKVTWDEVEEADHYLTDWIKDQRGSSQILAQASNKMNDQKTNDNQYIIPNFNPGSDYNVYTRSVNSNNAKSARAFARYNPPPPPSNLDIDAYGIVTWDAVSEANHYLVDWIKGSSPWNRENQASTNRFSISNFDATKDYIATVRSVTTGDVESFPAVAQSWSPPTVRPPTKLSIRVSALSSGRQQAKLPVTQPTGASKTEPGATIFQLMLPTH